MARSPAKVITSTTVCCSTLSSRTFISKCSECLIAGGAFLLPPPSVFLTLGDDIDDDDGDDDGEDDGKDEDDAELKSA